MTRVPETTGKNNGMLFSEEQRSMLQRLAVEPSHPDMLQSSPEVLMGYSSFDESFYNPAEQKYNHDRQEVPKSAASTATVADPVLTETREHDFPAVDIDFDASFNELTNHAACASEDPELFFPNPSNNVAWNRAAKEVCNKCVIKQNCADYALKNRINEGVWGALSEDERRSIHRRNSRAQAFEA